MIILNKISDTNFQATRVLKTQRFIKSNNLPRKECVELFELDKTDTKFAEKCYYVLKNIQTRKLPPLQKQLKTFLKNFLEDKGNVKHHYIAIKNSATISGGISALPCHKTVHLTQAFSDYPKSYNIENILYGVMNEIQKNYKGYKINTYNLINNIDKDINSNEIHKSLYNISCFHCNDIHDFSKQKNIDLEEVLDIKDFETDVLY